MCLINRGFRELPRAVVLPGITRDMILTSPDPPTRTAGMESPPGTSKGGAVALNTCTSDALAEVLCHLKRAYWPMPWDTSPRASPRGSSARNDVDGEGLTDSDGAMRHGGFRPAAKAACGDAMSAQLRALTTVANHRLERGM